MDAALLFVEMWTQWRPEHSGLDYTPLFARLDRRCGDDREAWERIYQQIRVMESEAIDVIAEERREQDERRRLTG